MFSRENTNCSRGSADCDDILCFGPKYKNIQNKLEFNNVKLLQVSSDDILCFGPKYKNIQNKLESNNVKLLQLTSVDNSLMYYWVYM